MPELEPLAVNLGATLCAGVVLALTAAAIGVSRRRHRIVDAFWGLGFAVGAAVGAVLSNGHGAGVRRWVVTAAVTGWGLRLTAHLVRRSWGTGEDFRYARMVARAPGNPTRYAVRAIYLTQALTLWVISWPVQIAQYEQGRPTVVTWAGVAVWAAGLTFEAVSDAQLARFRADPRHLGRVLDTGLWRYSRHPNYFGDCCVWWGLWLMAADTVVGLVTVGSPLLMTYLLVCRTGKPLVEAHLARSRAGYARYARRTSAFVPLPPRRLPDRLGVG